MITSLLTTLVLGVFLVAIQVIAALPWFLTWNRNQLSSWFTGREPGSILKGLGIGAGILVLAGVLVEGVMAFLIRDPDRLQVWGGIYGFVLHVQLTIDLFVVAFFLTLLVWPKGGAVALAAFREGLRHPMFWFMLVGALVLMVLMPFLPYFTFGEDFKMVKDLGYSTLMLFPAAFGVLAASMLISEEIEGRTAITLMSKPVSRRQFLVGKFGGLLLAALAMTAILSWVLDGMLVFKVWYDKDDPIAIPGWLTDATPHWVSTFGETGAFFIRGGVWWFQHATTAMPGVVLGFCQVMVLLAIAVALATRLPMIVNVNTCVVVFFLGNLAPVLSQVTQTSYPLIRFVAQLLDYLLPGLEFFNLGPTIARDTPPPAGPFAVYIGSVVLYALLYSGIALILGLILFEDRDLA